MTQIVSYKTDLVLVEGSVAYQAKEYLREHGITVALCLKTSVMDRVARCTQVSRGVPNVHTWI